MKYLLCLFLLPAMLIPASPVRAADKAAPAVVVMVDMQRILQESLAAKSVQKQVDTRRAQFQSETEKEENDLRQAEQDLAKSRATLPQDAYAEHEQQLRQRFLGEERHVEARRKVLDQAFTDSMNTVRDTLLTIVQAVAHDRGANMVLMRQQALWVDPNLDATDTVLERLNKGLPQVTVKMDAE